MKQPRDTSSIQRQRLAAWLQAWQLTRRLEAVPDAPGDPAAAPHPYSAAVPGRRRKAVSCTVGDPARLQPGDIILMPPDAEATRSRPVYVALLEPRSDGRWLAAPFGSLPLPAVPGELATGRRADPLRVLCIWNAAAIVPARLARGWRVGRLLLRERRWARLLLDAAHPRTMPAALRGRLGPPLVHPLDPRHDYLEQERLLWVEPAGTARCGELPTAYDASPPPAETIPLAADERGEYQ